jgi:tetratricopeptide (TPR) repeat protein
MTKVFVCTLSDDGTRATRAWGARKWDGEAWRGHRRLSRGGAEPLFRQAIKIGEKALGKDHAAVAIWYDNLALLFQDQGKYAEAEPLFRRAIEISQNTLGPEHPNTVRAKENYDFISFNSADRTKAHWLAPGRSRR